MLLLDQLAGGARAGGGIGLVVDRHHPQLLTADGLRAGLGGGEPLHVGQADRGDRPGHRHHDADRHVGARRRARSHPGQAYQQCRDHLPH
jgi:hypothetical protein